MKPGDKVRLISVSQHDRETYNWIEKEDSKPLVGDVFTIHSIPDDGWLRLEELQLGHPSEKFELLTKTNTMKHFKDHVFFHTPTPELSTAVQFRLFELGYSWVGEKENRVESTEYDVIGINFLGSVGLITYSSGGYENKLKRYPDNEGDLSLLFYSDHYKTEKNMTIAGHDVQIQDNSIKVGCTEVSKEELQTLFERLQLTDWFKK